MAHIKHQRKAASLLEKSYENGITIITAKILMR